MKTSEIVGAWKKILRGERPSLSIEITRECPLKCPGCYAYDAEHLGGGVTLRSLNDRKGQELIDGVLNVVDRFKPLHLSIVGGDPLVRYRELETMMPLLLARGIHVQVVTSAFRPLPSGWDAIAEPDVRCLDRRTAARTRRPPCARDLRSHPEEHRRAEDHNPLHNYRPDDEASGISAGVPRILDASPRNRPSLV